MKKWLEIIGILILTGLFIYFVGTKPTTEKKEEQVNINSKQWDKPPELSIDKNKKYTAKIETPKGNINIELFVSTTPITVNNFIFLSRQKYYDKVIFHRIIKDFMIQSGDPTGTGSGGPGYSFADEAITQDYKKGVLAMANSGPNTNGSQFFIMTKDNQTLPKNYVIFGSINSSDTESYKTLENIAQTPVEANDQGEMSKPKETIAINTITIEEE